MTGSEFIRKLTELTKAGKVKWEDNSIPFLREYTVFIEHSICSSLRVTIDEKGEIKITFLSQTIYNTKCIALFNAISDTMPDIQTLFDNAIKELEK